MPLNPIRSGQSLYAIVPPDNAQANRPSPLLCFLHGRGEVQPDGPGVLLQQFDEMMTVHGPLHSASDWPASNQSGRFIRVVVQCPPPAGHTMWRPYQQNVEQIVQQAVNDFDGDRDQIFLSGFSYGACGALDFLRNDQGVWRKGWITDPPRAHCRYNGGINRPLIFCVGAYAHPGLVEVGGVQYHDWGLGHGATSRRAFNLDLIYRELLDEN